MSLKLVTPEQVRNRRELIMVYGVAGMGKTRFVTSLTERFGEIIYIAIDEGSENLDSVLPQYRDRIHVYRPDWQNPLEDAGAIANTDWQKLHPGAKTIVIDTFSTWTWFVLQYITNKGMFSTKRVTIGEGTPLSTALPDVGEYGGVHAQIRQFVSLIFNNQKAMNVIFVCHTDPPEGGSAGGPATVGKKMTTWLPARFKTVLRLDQEVSNVIEKGAIVRTSKHVVRAAAHGDYIARINEASAGGNPIPVTYLNNDPINFWIAYDNLVLPKEAPLVESL